MDQINPRTKNGQFFGLVCFAGEMIRKIADIKMLEDPTDGETVSDYINQNVEEAMAIFDEFCIYLAKEILNL
jgi:hypothetical protein